MTIDYFGLEKRADCTPLGMDFNPVAFEYNENYTRTIPRSFSKLDVELTADKPVCRKIDFLSGEGIEYHAARVVEVEKLKTGWREVYRMKLDKKFDFKPGDSIGILCPNSDVLVEEVMSILGNKDGGCRISRGGRTSFCYTGTVRDFFKYHFDFAGLPKKSLLARLGMSCDEESRKHIEYLCSKERTADYLAMGHRWNNIIDVIRTFGCKPTLEDLVGECEVIRPRYFSLTNEVGRESEVLIGITAKSFDGFVRYGHVSDWVIRSEAEEVEVCLRTNLLFQMDCRSRRMLAICTGTGIAPFLSFASNLQMHQRIWIVYGFRNDEDDISRMLDPDERIRVSRVKSSHGTHVTDYLASRIDEVKEYVDGECVVYVCGRMDMQRQVFEMFRKELPAVVETKRLVFDQWA